ncbi:Ovate protein family, C-terminal [Parasponia andersonii]|uniref:Transcription repressor n=1 Tax=Parasponia andersonii TaxID=3476 RepID=A0A2P5D325_PARAD|nr:Ovate protein family, C-terminal [Parasponia andersonii]
MAKRFKLRISRIIPSFNPCGNSKDPSSPIPSFFRSSTVSPTVVLPKHRFPSTTTTTTTTPPTKPHRSSLKRHVSSAFMSVGCGRRGSKPTLSDYDDNDVASSKSHDETYFQWEKQDNWHVIAKVYDCDYNVVETPRRKIYTSSVSGRSNNGNDDGLPPPPPPPSSAEKSKKKQKKRRSKKKTTTVARSILRISTSSAESGLFSSEGFDDGDENDEEEEETETLVSSSRSFSTDSSSSEFNPHLETIREVALDNHPSRRKNKKKNKKRTKRCVSKKLHQARKSWSSATAESGAESTPARLSMFQRMIPCTVDGKVRESFAVIKKSEDPYVDFKRSMMEMILEKQMFDDKDLEQLLHCFLSLNSRDHHGIIVQAFSEIWEVLFCSQRVSRAL